MIEGSGLVVDRLKTLWSEKERKDELKELQESKELRYLVVESGPNFEVRLETGSLLLQTNRCLTLEKSTCTSLSHNSALFCKAKRQVKKYLCWSSSRYYLRLPLKYLGKSQQ